MAKWLILIGVGFLVLGVLVFLVDKTGLPLGRLPGDIHIERKEGSFHFPLVTSLIVSLVLTLLLNLLLRLFR